MSRPLQAPPLSLALACFASALAFLALGSAGLLWVAPDLARGWFPLPRAIAVVHLFTLGWITLSIIAALHHFVPVALHTRLMGSRAAWLQLGGFNIGLAGFTAGELLGFRSLALAGAFLVASSLLVFACCLGMAMLRLRPRGRTAWALLAAAGFLLVTLVLGLLLTGGRAYGWLGADRLPVLTLHVRIALVGWVLLVLVSVAQRLLPMFLLTRAPAARFASLSLALVGAGAIGTLAVYGRTGAVAWLPLLFTAGGLGVFLAQVVGVFRRGARLDTGLRLAAAGLFFLALSLVAAPFAAGSTAQLPQRLVLLVSIVVLGGLTLFIAGHYYRLVPFLVWSSRWAHPSAGVVSAGGPGALFHPTAAAASLVLLVTGATILLAALGRGLAAGARAGAVLFACGATVLVWQMAHIMGSRPR